MSASKSGYALQCIFCSHLKTDCTCQNNTVVETTPSAAPRAVFENGSTRSERKPPYHLVPAEAVTAIAERLDFGWDQHGEENWKRGGPRFFAETKNHLMGHCLQLLAGDTSEDHLAAVLTNAAMLAWWRKRSDAWVERE